MKHRYFYSFLGFVLVFGLSSCKSEDSQSPQEDNFLVTSVDYIHKDKSLHNINDTKELAIDSTIDLNISNRSTEDFSITGESQCFSPSFEKPAFHNQFWVNQTSIPVKELLPLEVFAPLKTQDDLIICDFQLVIKNAIGSKTTIDLKDIKITKLFGYYEMNLLNSPLSQPEIYLLEDEIKRVLDLKVSVGKIHLICENHLRTMILENSSFPFEVLKKFFWLEKEIDFCRFVLEDLQNKVRTLGKAFYIQSKKPKLDVQFQAQLPNGTIFHGANTIQFFASNKSVAQIEIFNDNSLPILINPSSFKASKLQILGHFSKGKPSDTLIYGNSIQVPIRWTAQNGKWIQKDNKKFLQLNPQESLVFLGEAQSDFNCPQGSMGVDACNSPRFQGYRAKFFNLPEIAYNKFLSSDKVGWTETLVVDQTISNFHSYPHWFSQPWPQPNCNAGLSQDEFTVDTPIMFSDSYSYQCVLK